MNPLFQMLNNQPANGALQLLQRFQQFRQNYNGNPQQQIQQMLQNGQITQQQYNSAVQMAQQLQRFMH